jgi:hypothetical protein
MRRTSLLKPIRNQGPGSDYAECIYIYIFISVKGQHMPKRTFGNGLGSVLKKLNFFFY